MVKKITALLLCFVMLFSMSVSGAEFSDVSSDSEEGKAIGVLSELGILSGMGDGTFSPHTYLTRAQFAKIAVCIMGKTDEAVVTTSAFSDVDASHWCSGYINVVAKEGIITGYPSGSFGVDENISYAQALTVVVRLLGYNASDVGHKWPQGYIDKAKVLGLTENMSFNYNDPITREKAALIIYRALFTDMKGTKTALVTNMDANVYEDAVIIATNKQNSALLANQFQSDKGIFSFDNISVPAEAYLGCQGTLVANDENEVIAFVPSDSVTGEEYTVSGVYAGVGADSVNVMTEKGAILTLNNKTVIYMNDGAYAAEKLTEGINAGSRLVVFSENNAVKYVFVDEYVYDGPEVVYSKSDVTRLFNVSDVKSLKVIRKTRVLLRRL